VLSSFSKRATPDGTLVPTLEWYAKILGIGGPSPFSRESLPALVSTVGISAVTATGAVTLGGFFAFFMADRRESPASLFLILPIGTSSIALTVALVSTYPWLSGSLLSVFAIEIVVFFPFAFNSLRGVLKRIPRSLHEAARTLGASGLAATRTIDLPLLSGGIAAAWAFCFGLSAGELNIVLALGIPGLRTVPLAMYRMVGSYNYFAASALGVLLAVLAAAIFYLAETLRGDADVV
jgi:thiamine transport system permease protein